MHGRYLNVHAVPILIAAMILGVTFGHYTTPISHHHWHEIFRRLYYVPILVAALHYGFRGGLISSVAVGFIYLPHVVFQWSGPFLSNLIRFDEIVMFLLIGNLAGLLADRTRREKERYRKTAEALDQAYRNLKRQSEHVTELEYQLRSADRLAVLGELTASLAHEVRNPLGSIKGAADILKKRCKADQTSREFAGVLTDEVARLNRVVDNYLSLAGPQKDSRETSDAVASIKSVFQLTGPQIRKKRIRVITDWPGEAAEIPLSEVESRQIFLNLMLNALSEVDTGGEVRITVQKSDKTVRIDFADNGPGIAGEHIGMIFNPFFSTKKEGAGLGLAIVKRMVESRGGKIEVQSQPNQGTTFVLTFPSGARS